MLFRPESDKMMKSPQPDTILVPSGENPTESTTPRAFDCSATGIKDEASGQCARNTHLPQMQPTVTHRPPTAHTYTYTYTHTRARTHVHASEQSPHSLMLKSVEPDTTLVESGEKPTECTAPAWALVCSAISDNVEASATPRTNTNVSAADPNTTYTERARAPHSLMLQSPEPEIIFVPSGEKPTEFTTPPCALICSASSVSVDASVRTRTAVHTLEWTFERSPVVEYFECATQARTPKRQASIKAPANQPQLVG
jgi:hypothetical protein